MPVTIEIPRLSDTMRRTVDVLLECYEACAVCESHCIDKGGPFAAPDRLRVIFDCAEICRTTADVALRGTVNKPLLSASAATCECCAVSCEQLGDDPIMRSCAEACRRCLEACRCAMA